MNTKHPIICLPMNRVSNIDLAIAVAKAGCLPSVIMVAYSADTGNVFREEKFKLDMLKMKLEVGHCNIIVSMTDHFLSLHHDRMIKMIEMFGITHIEILPYYGNQVRNIKNGEAFDTEAYSLESYVRHLIKIKSSGCKIIVKCLAYPIEPVSENLAKYSVIDAIVVKSAQGAGKVSDYNKNIFELTRKAKRKYPSVHVISSGGISTSNDITQCLQSGATAVGIGTMFALSKESKIHIKTKEALMSKTSEDIRALGRTGLGLNAIVFKEHKGPDDVNFSQSLDLGVKGAGGHLYVGHAINKIDQILSVEEIVSRLTS